MRTVKQQHDLLNTSAIKHDKHKKYLRNHMYFRIEHMRRIVLG